MTLPDAAGESGSKTAQVRLTTQEKLDLIKPLVIRFMLPLFAVYVEEYVINSVRHLCQMVDGRWARSSRSEDQIYGDGMVMAYVQGVAPTLVFPLPTHGPWSRLFKSPRDYYPFWSLTCEWDSLLCGPNSLKTSMPTLHLNAPPAPIRDSYVPAASR